RNEGRRRPNRGSASLCPHQFTMVNLADPDCLKDFQSTAPMVTISYPHEGFSLHYRTSNNSPTSSKRSSLEPETSTAAEVEDIINHDAPKMGYPLIETCP
ncbi:hypothetical protein PENTCL1PPCAC_7872, partial [Pristionchus entomophagus]